MNLALSSAPKTGSMSAFSRWGAGFMIVALCLSALSACDYNPFNFVPINEIVQNPTRYDGQQIKVKGKVSNVTKIPFMEIKLYALNENGQQITVLANATVPAAGSEVAVIGVVENLAIVGDQSIGLHLREIKRLDHVFY